MALSLRSRLAVAASGSPSAAERRRVARPSPVEAESQEGRRKARQPRRIFVGGRPWFEWFRCVFTHGERSRSQRDTSSKRSMPLVEPRTAPPIRTAYPAGRRISRRVPSWLPTPSLIQILSSGLPLWRSRPRPRWWGGLPRSSVSSPAVSARMPLRPARLRNYNAEISPNTRSRCYHWLSGSRDSQTLRKQGLGPLKALSSASSALTGLTPKKANVHIALVRIVATLICLVRLGALCA
jgi:hypothetical protein